MRRKLFSSPVFAEERNVAGLNEQSQRRTIVGRHADGYGATAMEPLPLSIVIPAYNEARRIGATLARIRAWATASGWRCEVLVVDDGSRDETAQVAQQFNAPPLELRVLRSDANRGKGHAVRTGMRAAAGDWLLLCDADLSTPIEQVFGMLEVARRGYDVVIGSRDLPDSQLAPAQPLTRRWAAAVFRALRRRLLLPALRDTQCGFKLFRREVAHRVFGLATIDGWLFDCEVLALAEALGYRLVEVAVVWRNDPDTRVRPLQVMWSAIPTLLAIRRRVGQLR